MMTNKPGNAIKRYTVYSIRISLSLTLPQNSSLVFVITSLFLTRSSLVLYMSRTETSEQYFPADPLEDVDASQYSGGENYSQWYSEGQDSTFEDASRDLFLRRPVIPHSELNCIRNVRPKKKTYNQEKDVKTAHGNEVPINRHKLSSIPPNTDPYELVKLVRKGWTLSKVDLIL